MRLLRRWLDTLRSRRPTALRRTAEAGPRIVVNHLTRMRPGCICVAGMDVNTGEVIRPVLEHGPLPRDLLVENGGLFALGAVVDLGGVTPHRVPPHVEDRIFSPGAARLLGYGGSENFWGVLRKYARPRLVSIFGEDLLRVGQRCAVPVGAGRASLGLLIPAESPRLYRTAEGRLRLEIDDGLVTTHLSVTDLRLYEADYQTVRTTVAERVAARLRSGEPTVLSVGLTRAWQRPDDPIPRHWVQLNNIHFQYDATWNGGPADATANLPDGRPPPVSY